MQLLNMLFLKILEMSLTAGIVIIFVLLVRLLLRGLPKNYSYMLWLVVAFRLVVPFSADSNISIFNLFVRETISSETSADNGVGAKQNMDGLYDTNKSLRNNIGGQATQKEYEQNNMADQRNGTQSALSTKAMAESKQALNLQYPDIFSSFISKSGVRGGQYSVRRNGNFINIMAIVWIAGMIILSLYSAISYMRLKRQIRYSVLYCDNIYECDQIRSPFIAGIIRPGIYLPFRLCETERQCVLAHEQYHMKRKDYLIKPFAYVLVILYWFQPLVWIAYHLMCIDMEMSCDEKIISEFTVDMRKEYSRLLLAFATNKRQRPVSPLAFGEENTVKRIRNILNYKKAAPWKLAVGVAAIMLTMAACATDANENQTITSADQAVSAENNVLVRTNQPESNELYNAMDTMVNNNTSSDAAVASANGTSATVHHSERHIGESSQETQYHMMAHRQAQWAENSMCDTEFCSLDYADADKIVFHISSGLFQYDLQKQRITRSVDLKALNCQEVQTGGKCRITVYQNSDGQLKAVIAPYPYSDEGSYIYDLESDVLFAYDEELLVRYAQFDELVSKYELPEEDRLAGWEHAEHILPLGEHSYGVLRWSSLDLVTMYYEAGNQRWDLFQKEQATLPRLIRQDDSFYQAISMYSGKDIHQCLLDYMGLYNIHDYAGVCALSTGLEYSEEMQKEFSERSDTLSGAEEVSHSKDGMEYLFQFSCGDDYGTGEKVYVNFKYIESVGWRAEDFPDISRNGK